MNEHEDEGRTRVGHGRAQKGWVLAGLLGVAIVAGGTSVATIAVAQGMHPSVHGPAASDPAAMDRHFEAEMRRTLPDATTEQMAQLTRAVHAVHANMGAVHAEFGKAHARLLDLAQQPRVDRAAMEATRAEQVRAVDAASARMVTRFADVAEMLTPEQRVRFFAHAKMRVR